MRVKRCCIPYCKDREGRRFYIPGDERIREIWLERIGKPILFQQVEENLKKSYPICERHFDPICRDEAGRLKRYSLPTLHVPEALAALPSTSAYSPGKWPPSHAPKVYKSKKVIEHSKEREASSTQEMCFSNNPDIVAKETTLERITGKSSYWHTSKTQILDTFETDLGVAPLSPAVES